MELFVYSRRAIERTPPHDVPHAVISITSAPSDVARIPHSPLCLGVLRLAFADVAHPERRPELIAFSPLDARAVRDFFCTHRDRIDRLVVHCDAGHSRSPAIAAALCRVLRQDDSVWFRRYHPNLHVYRSLLDAFEEREERGDGDEGDEGEGRDQREGRVEA